MSRFIKLNKGTEQKEIVLNTGSILYFYANVKGYTSVRLIGDITISVIQSSDEILSLINDERKAQSLPSGNFGAAMRGDL